MTDVELNTTGKCAECNRHRNLNRRLCLACRHAPEHRPMIEAGIPCSTVGVLVNLMRKLKGGTATKAVATISIVHPILMENLKVGKGWMLVPRSDKYEWTRRNGWNPVAKAGGKAVQRT